MKHKRPPIPVIIVVIVLLAGLGGWWWWSATRPAPDAGLTLSGQVETDEIAVAPAMAGRITAIKVSEGDQVTKGQVLVQLDTAALKLQLSQTKQGVKAAKAAVTNARDDGTKADVKAAKARQAQAEAAVELARVQLGYATIKAPAAGTVVNVVGNAGANAAPGRTVLTLTDPASLFVRVFVPEPQIGQVVVVPDLVRRHQQPVEAGGRRAELEFPRRQQRTLLTSKEMTAVSGSPARWGAGWNMDRWSLGN